MIIPSVSVLMTAYNREKYIAGAIESVLASAFKDFELIIVDDCSTDRTVEIARRYLSDPRVQVHVNEKNLGDYPNRNRAASLARGKYLKYVDSDDIIYPYGLQAMVSAMEKFPDAAMGIERPPNGDRQYPLSIEPREAYVEHFLMRGLLDAGPTGVIIRESSFREAGGFSGKRYVGDTEMWLKLAARWPVVKFPQGLIWWRQHAQQEFKAGYISYDYDMMLFQIKHAALVDSACPFGPAEREKALARLRRGHARWLLRLAFQKGRLADVRRIMRSTNFRFIDLFAAFTRPQ
jgi:glycosyltransferase involved in cell wall biosynthesis